MEATMSRANLEQILELLLAEENEQAEEALHEYVVSKARAEYEKVLDESEEEAEEVEEAVEDETVEEAVDAEEDEVEEAIDQRTGPDFIADIEAAEEDVHAEEIGEDDDEEEDSMDPMGDMDMGDEEGDDDIEDKVDDLESELEDLRAEFEKLLADTDEDGDGDHDMDDHAAEEDDEDEVMDSVEYDLGEAEEADSEEIEEATKMSDSVARQPLDGKQVEADSSESPYSKAPKHTSVASQGSPVKAKDGSEGKKGEAPKDHTPTDNIKVEPKKA